LKPNDDFRYKRFAVVVAGVAIVLFVFVYGPFTSEEPGASRPFDVARSERNEASEGQLAGMRQAAPGSARTQGSSAATRRDTASLAHPGTQVPAERGTRSVEPVAQRTQGWLAQRTEGPVVGKETPPRGATHGSAARTPSPNQASPRSGEPAPAAQATSGSDQPTPAAGDARNDLSISGRVLDQARQPIPGIEVTARKSPSQPDEAATAGVGQSGADGRYEIRGLTEGEYAIRATATTRYRAGDIVAQAGFSSADIILEGDYEIRVSGTVTDTEGQPLAGVRVVPADLQRQTQTDSNGNYEAFLVIKWAEGTYAFQFLAKGYRDKLVYLKGADIADLQETRVDAQLEPLGDTTVVAGVVTAEDGSPVAGATIQLQSNQLKTSYNGVSRGDGRFSIADVRTGADYVVNVLATSGYQDYTQGPVAISAGAALDVVLHSLDKGRLIGRMVDAEGNPIPRFSLWLTSTNARAQALPVSSDDTGSFVVDQAPVGVLTFATRSVPALQVSGITMNAGDQQEVSLVLDWGDLALDGRVTDDRGGPVGRVQVLLSWSEQAGGMSNSSMRTTLTGNDGEFHFTQLGPGPHRISVSVPGSSAPQVREVPAGTRQFDLPLASGAPTG
jgi:carboxypeptidase family protein